MIKKLLATAVMAIYVTSAQAATVEDLCPAIGEIAENIMTARQNNMPMSEVMAIVAQGEAIAGLAREMVIIAYDKPKFDLPDYQSRSISSFRNDMESVCYSAVSQ